jgi:electron transfer flavoprotein alpha subunit
MAAGILVVAEHLRGEMADITFEMLGVGRKMADALGAPLHAAIMGENARSLATQLGTADAVSLVEGPELNPPSPGTAASLIQALVERQEISMILIGGTNMSYGIGPTFSARSRLPFINFCTDVQLEGDSPLFTCQLFGGKILVGVSLRENRGMISIYPGSFPAEDGRSDRSPEIHDVDICPTDPTIVFQRFIEPELDDVDLTKEDVLVAIGRGIKTEDNVEMAEELAKLLGGVLCGSRPVIDQGWLSLNRQVGKSGKIVKPKLYLALGISGAPEHMEGMQNADLIFPINTDPEAPIFSVAHYGVCEDLFEIVPSLIDEIRARKGEEG